MVEYYKVNTKLSDSQLNELKNAVKNQTGVTLKMNIKIFEENNLPHELLLTTSHKTVLRNAFQKQYINEYKVVQSSNI